MHVNGIDIGKFYSKAANGTAAYVREECPKKIPPVFSNIYDYPFNPFGTGDTYNYMILMNNAEHMLKKYLTPVTKTISLIPSKIFTRISKDNNVIDVTRVHKIKDGLITKIEAVREIPGSETVRTIKAEMGTGGRFISFDIKDTK